MPSWWSIVDWRVRVGINEDGATTGGIGARDRVGVYVGFEEFGGGELDEEFGGHPAIESSFMLLAELSSVGCVRFMEKDEREVNFAERGKEFLEIESGTHGIGSVGRNVLGVNDIREQSVDIFLEVLDVDG